MSKDDTNTEETPPSSSDSKEDYIAFISYAHKDNERDGRKWAYWLKSKIESYPIPEEIAGKETPAGPVPDQMQEVFLDREELAAGGELTPKLKDGLNRAKYLVVICSPRSAANYYVNLEIEYFIQKKGYDHVIPVVVDGDDGLIGSANNWIPKSMVKRNGEGDEEVPLYVDFRVKEIPRIGGPISIVPGWTDPADYDAQLKEERHYRTATQRKLVRDYEERHNAARIKLLASLLKVRPSELNRQAALQKLEKKSKQFRRFILGVAAAAAALSLAGFSYYSSYKAKIAEQIAYRSMRMIGDAHRGATDLAAAMLTDVRKNLENDEKESILPSARQIVDDSLDQYLVTGEVIDGEYLESISLDSRGMLAFKLNDFSRAEELFDSALRIRIGLVGDVDSWEDKGNNAMYLHSLTESYDYLGDLRLREAELQQLKGDPTNVRKKFNEAYDFYQQGLDAITTRIAKPEPDLNWVNDLVVSYMKLGEVLYFLENDKAAMAKLKAGFPFVEILEKNSEGYQKWSEQIGVYYYHLGRVAMNLSLWEEANTYLSKGKDILTQIYPATPSIEEDLEDIERRMQAL